MQSLHEMKSRTSCPAHVIDHVQAAASVAGGCHAVVTSVEEVKSAQQLVYVLTVDCDKCEPAGKNAKGSVLRSENSDMMIRALKIGRNRIVVRIWKASARWWNFNTNDARSDCILQMARAEIAGYRLARAALTSSDIITPEVIHFSDDYSKQNTSAKEKGVSLPWALFTYIGEKSMHFGEKYVFDGKYAKDMVKARHEFGFDESHPRHGRVEAGQSIQYALEVMDNVVLPIQDFFLISSRTGLPMKEDVRLAVRTLGNTCASDGRITTQIDAKPYWYQDMIALYENAACRLTQELSANGHSDATMSRMVETLKACISALSSDAKDCAELAPYHLPPVLVHMDLQPQNVILRRAPGTACEVDEIPQVSSVLDWEEACFADPRFEVMLMARKVVASREQADRLWNRHAIHLRESHGLQAGSIVPWLKLEATHSIVTLLMQSLNLVGGGRSPWESKSGLLGKIKREFSRLKFLGWEFCDKVVI